MTTNKRIYASETLVKVTQRLLCEGSDQRPSSLVEGETGNRYGAGLCPSCSAEFALRKSGTLMKHYIPTPDDGEVTLYYLQLPSITWGRLKAVGSLLEVDGGVWASEQLEKLVDSTLNELIPDYAPPNPIEDGEDVVISGVKKGKRGKKKNG